MWYDRIIEKIKKCNSKVKKIEILANKKNINNIIGHKRENIINFKKIYDVDVKISVNNKIKLDKFKINILEVYN